MKKLVFTIILFSVCSIYAQTGDKENLKRINQDVHDLYQNQEFDEALKLAQQAVKLSLKTYGMRQPETAATYTTLGVIYHKKRNFDESIVNLQKAVEIYQNFSDSKTIDLITTYQILAHSQLADGKETEAEANYLKAIKNAENKFGKESRENFLPTLSLATFYAQSKKYVKADDYYLESFAIATKNFGKASVEVEQIEDSRSCLISARDFSSKRDKTFFEAKKKLLGETDENGGIINRKAIYLPKPYYPSDAKQGKLRGVVSVRVRVDEQGNVTSAKAICGPLIFQYSSVEAAVRAKFAPPIIDGKPIKISGIIIYNFIP